MRMSPIIVVCILQVAKAVFGECSLVVSKYYGNLGRLYQARQEFDKVCVQFIMLARRALSGVSGMIFDVFLGGVSSIK
jgi:hypothetical protein